MSHPLQSEQLLDDPIPSPRTTSPGLFFSGADNATTLLPEPGAHLTDEETGLPILPPAEAPGWASDSGWSADEKSGPDDQSSSDTSPAGSPLSKAAARQTARAAVLTAGGMAHRFLAQTEGQRQVQLYLADEEDAAAIGNPLGNIAHRHSGAIGAAANPDVADGLQAMLGMFGYLSKQILATAQAKRIDTGGQPAPADPESYS